MPTQMCGHVLTKAAVGFPQSSGCGPIKRCGCVSTKERWLYVLWAWQFDRDLELEASRVKPVYVGNLGSCLWNKCWLILIYVNLDELISA